MLLVTGGAGFIGSNFITEWFRSHDESILTLDALTYAGNKANLRDVEHNPRHRFVEGNILDEALVADLFDRFRPRAVVHFAAESHVDRSISGPQVFVDTNVRGTTVLLGVAHRYWLTLDDEEKAAFRFINISLIAVSACNRIPYHLYLEFFRQWWLQNRITVCLNPFNATCRIFCF